MRIILDLELRKDLKCKCGHEKKEHYGGVSLCLASEFLIWKCYCGYYSAVNNSNSRTEFKKIKYRKK